MNGLMTCKCLDFGVSFIVANDAKNDANGAKNGADDTKNDAKNGANDAKNGADDTKNDAKNGANDAKNGAKNGANLTVRQAEIISMIKEYPSISLDEIAKKLRIGTTTLDREIKKLSNVIKRVGPRKGGYWEVIE